MRRTTVIQWLLSLLAFSVLLGVSSFFVWVSANPQRLTGDLSLPDNRGAVVAGTSTPVLLDTNAGYVAGATLTVVGDQFSQTLPFERAARPWRTETTWRAPTTMQPYTLTAQFTTFDGTVVRSDPLSVDVVPPGTIAYVEAPADGGAPSVYVMQTDSSNRELWATDATAPAWGPDGALYFIRAGAVWKQRSADAPAERVAGGTQVSVTGFSLGNPLALVDENGRLLLWYSAENTVHIPLNVDAVEGVAWRPDSEELLVSAQHDDSLDLFLWSQTSTTLEAVMTRQEADTQPAWHPDGGEIVFTSQISATDTTQIHWLPFSAESSDPLRITRVPFGADQASWSPTGDWIVYVGQNTPSPASREIILQRTYGRDPYTVQITRTDSAVYSPTWRMP